MIKAIGIIIANQHLMCTYHMPGILLATRHVLIVLTYFILATTLSATIINSILQMRKHIQGGEVARLRSHS